MASGGYGGGPWGGGAYGGSVTADSSFDLFCFEDCAPMLGILADPDVSTEGPGTHFVLDGSTCDLIIGSGGSFPTTNPRVIITTSVPQQFTLEWTARFDELPTNFNQLINEHVFVGTTDAAGPCAGLFISKIGVMYAGGVHHDAGGNLVVDSITQIIPDTADLIELGEYITFRMAVSLSNNVVYIFITKTADIAVTGHRLVAVLPVIPYTALGFPPTDRTIVSVRGGALTPSVISLDEICLSSAVLIPNLLPVADAGSDQAIRLCSIVQLNGESSFDPEGAPLTYLWRLVDAPLGSAFSEDLNDGATYPIGATGFTNKFHSIDLGLIDGTDPIDIGDVLLLDKVARTVTATGTDGNGFFLLFADQDIADSLSSRPFKVLRQRGISGVDQVKPTFFPDIPGFYTFDLVVNDGALSSEESVVIISVLESPLPRGCTPDLTFIFSYLSDFWNLVEDREPIEAFWGGLAQVAATELYTLWQHDYSKSLRDIQRTFIRRWLHYDPLLPEPLPELTKIRAVWGGLESDPIDTAGVAGVAGNTFALSSPVLDEVFTHTFYSPDPFTASDLQLELDSRLKLVDSRFSTSVFADGTTAVAATGQITTVAPGSYSDGQTFTLDDGVNPALTFEFDTVPDGVGAGNVVLDISAAADALAVRDIIIDAINNASGINIAAAGADPTTLSLTNYDTGSQGNVAIATSGAPPGTYTGMSGGLDPFEVLRIDAPFPFEIDELTTIPSTVFPVGRANTTPSGTGAGVGSNTYKVDRSLQGLDIVENDFLVLDGVAYRIISTINDAGDDYPFQRVRVRENLPASPSTSWAISGWVSSEFVDFYNGLVDADDPIWFEATDLSGENSPLLTTDELIRTRVLGISEAMPGRVAIDIEPMGTELAQGLTVYFAKLVRRHYVPVSSLVEDIPTLGEKIVITNIADEQAVLRRNLDFFIEDIRNGKGVRFVADLSQVTPDVWEGEDPPDRLWAEYTFLDNRPTIENNFGIPAEFTLDQVEDLPEDVDYLSAVRGLWYAFLNGPTVNNLRIGTQILLGLPFAEEAGTIEEIRTDFSPNEGRILIRDISNPEIVRSYTFPRVLGIETNPTTGVDYVVGDTVEQFAPLVEGSEIDDYIRNPTWFEGFLNQGIFFEVEKFHRFLVRVDSAAFSLSTLSFVRNFILKIKPTYTYPFFLVLREIGDTEVSITDDVNMSGLLILTDTPCEGWLGSSTLWDDPRAAGGGWRNQYDADADPDNADPTFPTADTVLWAYDKAYLCPADPLQSVCCVTLDVAATVTFDSCLKFDSPVNTRYSYRNTNPFPVASGIGSTVTPVSSTTAPFTGTISSVRVLVVGGPGTDPADYLVDVVVNGIVQASVAFTSVEPSTEVTGVVAVAVTAADVVTARIRPAAGGPFLPAWTQVVVDFDQAGSGVWTFGQVLPAGRYCGGLTTL